MGLTQIDYQVHIGGIREMDQLYTTSQVSDKAIINSDNFRIKCLSSSKTNAIL